MTWKRQYEKFLIVAVAVTFFSPNASRLVRGGGGSSLSARSFFQRTVDSPGEGANGTLELKKNGNKQSIQIDVHGLGDESMGIFIGTSTDTNDPIARIAPLNGKTNNHWVLTLESDAGAPPQLSTSLLTVNDLDDMAGFFLFVGNPAGATNIHDCVTNEVDGSVGNCITSEVFHTFLFTQIPSLSSANSSFNTKTKIAMNQPAIPESPNAKGTVITKFNASQGRSLFEVVASGLPGGQTYSLMLSNSFTVGFTNIAELTTGSGKKVSFKRDTKLGETLPLHAATVTNLSGTVILITDDLDFVHLFTVLP